MPQVQIREGQKFARFTNSGWDMTTVEEVGEETKWYINPVTQWLVIQFILKPLKALLWLMKKLK